MATSTGFETHLVNWAVQSVAMLLTALILPGLKVSGPIPAFLTVIALAFVNAHIWDAALFFEIPNTISYQMLTLLVANGVIFWIIVKILPGISISGIIAPILAPILFTLFSIGIGYAEKQIDWAHVFETSKEVIKDVKGYVKEQK